jgi:hypothetical protein
MYSVEQTVWVRVAAMHFEGSVAWWLQSVDHRIRTATWTELCSWIHEQFGRDEHDSLIRQLFHIKQTSSVQEDIDRFTELIDQLVVYGQSKSDHRYYTAQFVDGLKDDIKVVVLVQRPADLDTACILALLQEEAEASKRKDFKWLDYSFKQKLSATAAPMPLPLPPPLSSKAAAVPNKCVDEVGTRAHVDTKVAALCTYQMARGLCKYCAEKYVMGHKCAETVQLHVVQELWDLLQPDNDEESGSVHSDTETQCHLLLSKEAVGAGNSTRTLKFVGSIQGNSVVVLIDSGSSYSFISAKLAPSLLGISTMPHLVLVQVANGQILQSYSVLEQARWEIQGCQFMSSLKVIPLPYYDMIIGIDWLEAYSPMKVNWRQKWMIIYHFGNSVQLMELQSSLPDCSFVLE